MGGIILWCLMVQGWDEIAPTCVQPDLTYDVCITILAEDATKHGEYESYRVFCYTEGVRPIIFPINAHTPVLTVKTKEISHA